MHNITTPIHPTAQVSSDARLGNKVTIGAFTVIEADVTIGDNSSVGNFNTICTGTIIGEKCTIFHNCSIGEIPQDLKYKGEQTGTTIGSNVIVRENVTINRGTAAYGKTTIGNNVLLMAAAHIAHDCVISDNVIMANMATLGGHVEIKEYASLGGGVLVHQFCRIGAHVFIGGGFRAVQDVPPFILAAGEPLRYGGLNSIGLKRRGFSPEALTNIKMAYRKYFRSDLSRLIALGEIKKEMAKSTEVKEIINFIDASERGII